MAEDYGSSDYVEKEDEGETEPKQLVPFVDIMEHLVDDMPADELLIEYALAVAERVRTPISGAVLISAAFDPLDAIKVRIEDKGTNRVVVLYFKIRHPRILFSIGNDRAAVMLLGVVEGEQDFLEKIISWVTGLTDIAPV